MDNGFPLVPSKCLGEHINKYNMRLIRTLKLSPITLCLLLLCTQNIQAQICTNPANVIYGMDVNGAIYPITVATGAVGARINPAFGGNAPASANAMGYNSTNKKFYFFKRNADMAPQEFVSYDPVANTYAYLASCPTTLNIKTGCVNSNSTGYYCIDANAVLYYYRFSSNQWKVITSTYFNQWGTNITAILAAHSAGDIAMDGWGDLWFLCSSTTSYGLFEFRGSLPVAAVASITLIQKIPPTTPTPTGFSFAGIAFNPSGQIYLSTIGDDNLYRLNNDLTLTFLGGLTVANAGTDLTSCNFPMAVLSVNWETFTVESKDDQQISLSWTAMNENVKGFLVEMSKDGETWQSLAFVESNSQLLQGKYQYIYSSALTGKYYFRIKQVGVSGEYSYSQVKLIDMKSTFASVGPNPTKGLIRINNDANAFSSIVIFDLAGQLINHTALSKGLNSINIAQLPTGTYMLRLVGASGQMQYEKIIKE
jgi:hypothetical protein